MKITIAKSEKEFDCIGCMAHHRCRCLNEAGECDRTFDRDVLPAIFIGWWEKSILDILLMFLLLHSSDWTR